MTRLEHETTLARKHAVDPELYHDFHVGEAVMADGFPGRVTEVQDGPAPGAEAYRVVLDNGMGGGMYPSRLIYRAPTVTAALDAPELDPFEAGEHTSAAAWYPELGTILDDRPPIENLKVYANRTNYDRANEAFDAGHDHGYGHASTQGANPDTAAEEFANSWYDRTHASRAHEGWLHGYATWHNEEDTGLPHKGGAFTMADTTDDEDEPQPEEADPVEEQDEAGATEDPQTGETGIAGSAEGAESGEQDQPDSCSYCGHDAFDEFQDTGRGTRARCAQCNATMVKPYDGVQWSPEFPNSSQNAPSRQGDFRSTINDPRSVHSSLSTVAIEDFHFPETHHVQEYDSGGRRMIDSPESRSFPTRGWAEDYVGWLGRRHEENFGESMPEGKWRIHSPRPTVIEHEPRGYELPGRTIEGSLNVIATAEAGYPIFTGLEVPPLPQAGFEFTATWREVVQKATRLRKEGRVRVLGASHEGAVGEVDGDNSIYETEYHTVVGTRKIGYWHCGCKWAAWANTERTPAYKRFQNRPCSHNLALRYAVQSKGAHGREVTPDVDRLPGQPAHAPVQVQYQRPTERGEGRDIRRRAVPPGNMRSEWTERSRVRVKGSAGLRFEHSGDTHQMAGAREGESAQGTVHAYTADGKHVGRVDYRLDAHQDGHEHGGSIHVEDPELAAGHEEHGPALMAELERHLRTTHGLDREPNWTYADEQSHGAGHFAALSAAHEWARMALAAGTSPAQALVDLCRAGATHTAAREVLAYATASWAACGVLADGTEAFLLDVDPQTHTATLTDGREIDTGLLKFATHPFGEEGIEDALPQHEPSMSAPEDGQSAMQSTGMYDGAGFGVGNPAQDYRSSTPHTHSENPVSTGWATSADPPDWTLQVNSPSNLNTYNAVFHDAATSQDDDTAVTHAGVALKAGDTGRVLMIQRSNHDENDPASGRWEFPGGGLEDGDKTSLHGGIREFEEETGQPFPAGAHMTHVHRNKNYVLHTLVTPKESDVDFSNGRGTTNPDDPDGDDHEQSAWWEIAHAQKNPALRDEVKKTPWDDLKKAASVIPVTSVRGDVDPGTYESSRPTTATLHDEPEPALPSTDGAAEDEDGDITDGGPQAPVSPEPIETMRQAPWGFPESSVDPQGSAQDGDNPQELQDEEYNDDSGGSDAGLMGSPQHTPVVAGLGVDPVLAEFWKTAGGAALRQDVTTGEAAEDTRPGMGGSEPTDADIAATARAVLAKMGAKDFNFAEQRELIEEGMTSQARARNFDEMDLEGTHYALLADDLSDDEALWL